MSSVLLLLVFLVKVYAVARFSLTTMTGLVAATPLQVALGTVSFYAYLVMPALALTVAWLGIRAAYRHRADKVAPAAWPVLTGIVVVTTLMSPVEFLETGIALLAACLRLELRISLRPTRAADPGHPLPPGWTLMRGSNRWAHVPSWICLPGLPPLPRWQRLLSWLLLAIAVTAAWRSPDLQVTDLGWWLVAAAVVLEAPFSVWFRQALGSGRARDLRRSLWSSMGRSLARDAHLVKKAGQAVAGHLRGRTLAYLGGATAICYLLATVETPWAPAQIFVVTSPVEVSTQDKTVAARVLDVERVHVLVGYLLAKDDNTLTVLNADTHRIVHPPTKRIQAQPLCHHDQDQLPGKEPLWWQLQGIPYNSPNITCETLRELFVPARGIAFSPGPQSTAKPGKCATDTNATPPADEHTTLAAAGWDGALGLWDPAIGRSLGMLPPPTGRRRADAPPESGQVPYPIAFSPNGRNLAAAGPDGTVTVRDTSALQDRPKVLPAVQTPTGPPAAITALTFTPDSKTLITTTDDTTRIWDAATARRVSDLPPISGTTTALAVTTSNGRTVLATGGSDDAVRLWDLTDRGHPAPLGNPFPVHEDPLANWIYAIAFSPDGKTLAAGGGRRDVARRRFTDLYSADATVHLWDLADRLRDPAHPADPTPLPDLTGHTGAVNAIAFSPDGKTLATGSSDATTRLWNLTDRTHPTPPTDLTGHTGAVNAIAFSPDCKTLATAGTDQTLRLWDLPPRTDDAHPRNVLTPP